MKIRLTPELSYIIGLWRKRRLQEGIGVYGDEDFLSVFSNEAIGQELITSDKIQFGESKVYFYHTAYRKFFQTIVKDEIERFCYLNEYAANYLAGTFDAVGEIDEKGIVKMSKMNRQDEMMLLRLGFPSKRTADVLVIERPVLFLAFIKAFVKVKKNHKAFEYVGKKA
jgi:hypothetical protein